MTNRMLFKIIGGSVVVGIVVGFAIVGALYMMGVEL